GRSLRRDSRAGRAVPAGLHPAVPANRGVEPVRLDLSVDPEPAAGRARRRARSGADHAAALEHLARAPGARAAVHGDAVRGGPARLAAGPLRPHHAPPGRRGGPSRPLRTPAVPDGGGVRRQTVSARASAPRTAGMTSSANAWTSSTKKGANN